MTRYRDYAGVVQVDSYDVVILREIGAQPAADRPRRTGHCNFHVDTVCHRIS
jgi:hypothetical protein